MYCAVSLTLLGPEFLSFKMLLAPAWERQGKVWSWFFDPTFLLCDPELGCCPLKKLLQGWSAFVKFWPPQRKIFEVPTVSSFLE